ncbi:MAG TPA: transporter substrate-binding domain-containing protein [Pseudonocardiaceae bacterium]
MTRPVVALTTLCLATLVACDGGTLPPPPLLPPVVAVGVSSDHPGFGFNDEATSVHSGFDIDLARWLGQHMSPQFTVNLIDTAVDERIPGLKDGRLQLVINTFSITDARRAEVDFAGPYLITRQGVLVRTGNTAIRRIDDLAGQPVCASATSTSVDELSKVLGNRASIIPAAGGLECAGKLVNGEVVAVVGDQLALYGYAVNRPAELDVVEGLTFGSKENLGIGLPNGSTELCEKLTEKLREFITSGAWNQFFESNLAAEGLQPSHYRPEPEELDDCE